MKFDASHQPDMTAVIASTGGGKSTMVKRLLKQRKPRRLVIWDFKGEYPEFAPIVSSLVELDRALLAAGEGSAVKIAFRPSMKKIIRDRQFDHVCKQVLKAGNIVFLVEELSFVTTAQHPPEDWRTLNVIGRGRGLALIGTSQFPAQVDKSFLGQATKYYCGMINQPSHKKAMADAMDIDIKELSALRQFEFIEKDRLTQAKNKIYIKP